MGGQRTRQRTGHGLDKASLMLGISKDALRKRAKRGTVDAAKDENGNWVFFIDESTLKTGVDSVLDNGPDASVDAFDNRPNLTIQQMQSEIDHLRKQLTVKDDQIAANNKLVENMQVLLKQEQQRSQILIETSSPKSGFFDKWFKRSNNMETND